MTTIEADLNQHQKHVQSRHKRTSVSMSPLRHRSQESSFPFSNINKHAYTFTNTSPSTTSTRINPTIMTTPRRELHRQAQRSATKHVVDRRNAITSASPSPRQRQKQQLQQTQQTHVKESCPLPPLPMPLPLPPMAFWSDCDIKSGINNDSHNKNNIGKTIIAESSTNITKQISSVNKLIPPKDDTPINGKRHSQRSRSIGNNRNNKTRMMNPGITMQRSVSDASATTRIQTNAQTPMVASVDSFSLNCDRHHSNSNTNETLDQSNRDKDTHNTHRTMRNSNFSSNRRLLAANMTNNSNSNSNSNNPRDSSPSVSKRQQQQQQRRSSSSSSSSRHRRLRVRGRRRPSNSTMKGEQQESLNEQEKPSVDNERSRSSSNGSSRRQRRRNRNQNQNQNQRPRSHSRGRKEVLLSPFRDQNDDKNISPGRSSRSHRSQSRHRSKSQSNRRGRRSSIANDGIITKTTTNDIAPVTSSTIAENATKAANEEDKDDKATCNKKNRQCQSGTTSGSRSKSRETSNRRHTQLRNHHRSHYGHLSKNNNNSTPIRTKGSSKKTSEALVSLYNALVEGRKVSEEEIESVNDTTHEDILATTEDLGYSTMLTNVLSLNEIGSIVKSPPPNPYLHKSIDTKTLIG